VTIAKTTTTRSISTVRLPRRRVGDERMDELRVAGLQLCGGTKASRMPPVQAGARA
jgi:hypothetical protein